MATPYDTLVTGDVLNATLQVYTDILGLWVYMLVFMVMLGAIYYKSKSPALVSIVGLLVGAPLFASGLLPPEGTGVLVIIIVLGIAGTLYSVFKSGR